MNPKTDLCACVCVLAHRAQRGVCTTLATTTVPARWGMRVPVCGPCAGAVEGVPSSAGPAV